MTSLHDLGLAYRKAKADLYYSSHPSLKAIADYEVNLYKNLKDLKKKLDSEDESWITKPDFIGTWTLTTKSVDMSHWESERKEKGNILIFSSPSEEWAYACDSLAPKKKPKAEFRLMARCSLDFHVLSTLWIIEVGHLLDQNLTKCAYGNRLRRTKEGSLNKLSLGSFQPYLKPFRDWRDDGIKTMRTALERNKKILAITADIKSFYHELNPDFMLDPDFLGKVMKLQLTNQQAKLHRLFIKALQAWAESTPLQKGLPVGLPAAAVVANVALTELDRIIEQQLVPLYYGRYVDDILLVMENRSGFKSIEEIWNWIFSRSENNLNWEVNGEQEKQKSNMTCVQFKPRYLNDSRIIFSNSKSKIFMLSGNSGKTLVDAIAHQIFARASEWRAMPRLPRSAVQVATDLLAATQSDGEAADNLRKADALTMRRASFAIKLRDFEAYERDLRPDSWKEHRQAFFSAFVQHVMVLPQFFDLSIYLPRVIRLATACEDFDELRNILEALESLCNELNNNCTLKIKSSLKKIPPSELMEVWMDQVSSTVHESISAALPPRLTKNGRKSWNNHMENYYKKSCFSRKLINKSYLHDFQELQARLFSFDLAHMPFRFIGLPKEVVVQRGIPSKKTVTLCPKAENLLPDIILKGVGHLSKWIHMKSLPYGLLFSTRPYSLPELFILNKAAYETNKRDSMKDVVLSVRGFALGDAAPSFDKHGVLQIPDGQPQNRYGIAVSSWQTLMSSWTAAVMRMPDPDTDRYARLCRLLDGIISQSKNCRYLILPELALPAHWFIRIARKLQGRGISLITGVEYLHSGRARLRNQVWAALSHDGLGFPSLMIYRQDKQYPALHEEQELQRLAGLKLSPDNTWRTPPILQHGDLRFALLICSELTNIGHRAALRGKVDALFVPEWNQDTESFNALVESAALDIHAYIVQCNDRQYGDSRIRAPFKDSWKRDLLRVKGGITDYCVIGEIDVQALREFQSTHRSPERPFKPVPDGFKIDFSRRVFPYSSGD